MTHSFVAIVTPLPPPPLPYHPSQARLAPNGAQMSPQPHLFDGAPCTIHVWTTSFIKLCRPDDALVCRYRHSSPPSPSPLPLLPSTLGAQWRPNESATSPF